MKRKIQLLLLAALFFGGYASFAQVTPVKADEVKQKKPKKEKKPKPDKTVVVNPTVQVTKEPKPTKAKKGKVPKTNNPVVVNPAPVTPVVNNPTPVAPAVNPKQAKPVENVNPKVAGPDPVIGTDSKGRQIYQGKRGGKYYLTKSGNKEYIKQ